MSWSSLPTQHLPTCPVGPCPTFPCASSSTPGQQVAWPILLSFLEQSQHELLQTGGPGEVSALATTQPAERGGRSHHHHGGGGGRGGRMRRGAVVVVPVQAPQDELPLEQDAARLESLEERCACLLLP